MATNKYAQDLATLAQQRGEQKVHEAIATHGRDSAEAGQAMLDMTFAHKTLDALQSGDPKRCAFAEEKIYLPDWETGEPHVGYRECLARFSDAEGNALAPKDIFPALDRLGLSDYADARIVQLVANKAAQSPDGVPLGVNISPKSLEDADFRDYVQDVLAEHGKTIHGKMVLELTEVGALTPQSIDWLKNMRDQHGTHLALDDFGSRRGHHTVNHVAELQPDIVKLDGFGMTRPIFELEGSERAAHVTHVRDTIRDIRANAPETAVVAEFTETPGEYAMSTVYFGLDGVQSRELQGKYENQMTLSPEQNTQRWRNHQELSPDPLLEQEQAVGYER
jgi:EAL domain-containing protein (putative c-di-GMP-specific phosphodiesterase class I)